MDSTIREYEPGDLDACRDLWRQLTEHHRDIYANPGIGGPDPGVHFDAYLENPKLTGPWVAERDGVVVGLTGLLLGNGEAEIEPVVVDAVHRAQGIGRSLLNRALDEARRRGVKSVSIRPVARNASAIRHFFEAGFTLLGHLDMFQTLEPSTQEWQPGIEIHGHEFRF